MAINDLNQKYTIERYCTKMEVAKSLGTNLIEPFWKEIAEFRSRLAIGLPIFDTAHNHFSLTYFDQTQAKSSLFGENITKYIADYAKIKRGSIAEFTFTREMLKQSLKHIAKLNKIDASEINLSNIVEDKEENEAYINLIRYKNALLDFNKQSFGNVDEEFLANEYAILRGENELTSFYRMSDVVTNNSKALVDRDYDQGVPARMIEEMMASLFEYINNSNISLLCRITAIMFMFNYVKPFEKYNLELGILLSKRIIASSEVSSPAIYLPIEAILSDKDFFDNVSREVKKTHDFTYIFNKGASTLIESIELASSRITQLYAHELETESKMGSDPKKIKEEFGIDVSVNEVIKKVETKEEIQKRIEKPVIEKEQEVVSEKELKAKMNDMLESDPFLKKAQAHFYVHHSTKGRYYTIQQYIKFENCVYETGRTSMDNLAKLGYYRREQIKNKFVYTPIDKE